MQLTVERTRIAHSNIMKHTNVWSTLHIATSQRLQRKLLRKSLETFLEISITTISFFVPLLHPARVLVIFFSTVLVSAYAAPVRAISRVASIVFATGRQAPPFHSTGYTCSCWLIHVAAWLVVDGRGKGSIDESQNQNHFDRVHSEEFAEKATSFRFDRG